MGDLQPDGGSSGKTPQRTNGVRIPDSSFSSVNIRAPFFPTASDNIVSPSERAQIDAQISDNIKKAHSLHGAVAAKRQATTELLFFASVGDISRIKRICDTWGINVADESCRDYDKRTPLHLAAAEGCYSVVQWLLTEGKCDPNPIDRFNRTPLEDAVRGDHGEVVQLLVSNGAKVFKAKDGGLVELTSSRLSGFVRMWDDGDEALQPEWEIDPKDLQILEKVGEGEFGTVHKAKWYGTIVAVKILRRSDAVAVGDFRTELNTLQKVHHPHAVQFLGAVTHSQPYMMITEFLPGGSLTDLFKRVNSGATSPPSLRRATEMALDCARGMQYLHARNKNKMSCMHRDLKPANLMLGGIPHDSTDRDIAAELGVVKIADFGLSKSLAQNINAAKSRSTMDLDRDMEDGMEGHQLERYKLTGETGSYRYMAPEVFRHEPYNTKVDVYAFSMIAYELFEGAIPFGHLHPVEAARRAAMNHARPTWGKFNRYGKVVPEELKALVCECWEPQPDKRPSFANVAKRLQALFDAMPPDSKKKKCCIM
ncbi:Integrin-linked protein kinase 1 [Coccomyxa sp. Obi]|nr:Integrin-linked protein kinase 1 [Coccomyxa sp. Obi]